MRAAVVQSFTDPPVCGDVPAPTPGPDRVVVDVLGAGLHPRVRSQADGSHYTSTGELPLIPGIDGVGRTADGMLRYFVMPDSTMGSMAEQASIDPRHSVALPADTDPLLVAAAMNPAMSSWVALRRRIDFPPGRIVLVLGATGNAGAMAVQIAKRLGARQVIGVGRNPEKLAALPALGADAVVALGDDPDRRPDPTMIADVDVVLDYLWGEPAAGLIPRLVINRSNPARPLIWVQIGAIAGPEAAIPSAALRASGLQIVGSGQGSVTTGDILAELPALAAEIGTGRYRVDVRPVPLDDVTAAWTSPPDDRRVVIVP